MRNCLYKDFAEGLLQLLLLAIPLSLGLFSQIKWQQFQSVPLTLTLAIISLLYSEYNLYKDEQYKCNKRIKIELAISMIVLSVVLVWTLFGWRTSNNIDKYTFQVVLYGISVLPFVIETFYSLIVNDLKFKFKKKSKNTSILNIDLTSAKIN